MQRAYQRDPQAIERWQRETYPVLVSQAKREKAEIYFWDESGFRTDAVHGKTSAERGRTPVVSRLCQRQGISAASVVNTKRAFWFTIYQDCLSEELIVTLLKELMCRHKKLLLLVVDCMQAHKSKVVKDYVVSPRVA